MRPYQITPGGEWVDLDTIQSITPPVHDLFHTHYSTSAAIMRWRHAFQDKSREFVWSQPEDRRTGKPVADEAGDPTEVARMTREVFDPFFKAWTNQP